MKKIVALITYFLPLMACSQFNYWQQEVNYIIDVSLNDTEHTLEGFEKLEYINNSPDTLSFIWFHIWPNAFKNDKTAFSEQLLVNDRTDFYFSDEEQRGYINRLDFKINGITAKIEDHPTHIDIIKLLLPSPLPPHQTITITTPFHVKLPYNFSRGGHIKQSYLVTQWYPKPAVYDRKGWHPIPYLDQGEFYSEFGNYDVRVTLPDNYIVAATGELQNEEELRRLKQKALEKSEPAQTISPKNKPTTRIQSGADFPPSSTQTKSLRYLQKNVHDFAWFADKRFLVNYDTLKLISGRVIDVFSYYLPSSTEIWKKSIQFMKDAVRTRSEWLGEYPYNLVSAVEAQMGFNGGMEYPTITSISPLYSEQELEETITHEVSHNWLYGVLATNERMYPWMDEGMNTFYDNRYRDWENNTTKPAVKQPVTEDHFIAGKLPSNTEELIFETVAAIKKDQPVNTSSENFTELNYALVAYYKTGDWMKKLQSFLGNQMFDSCMHAYYGQWQFKHPYPEDFKRVVDFVSGKNTDSLFQQLDKRGSLLSPAKKSFQAAFLFNLKDTRTKKFISLAPAVGINGYDGFMIGAIIHNYQLPLPPFVFFVAPLYATHSKKFNILAKVSYNWYPDNSIYKVSLGMNVAKFTMNEFQPETGAKLFSGFQKLVPFIRLTFKEPDAWLHVKKYIQFKSFFIREDELNFRQIIQGADTSNSVNLISKNRNLNQLKLVLENTRVLYPYRAELQFEQQNGFLRSAFTGNYYFNYSNQQGGMNMRLFAGKFIYTGSKTVQKKFETDRYHLNLSGANGYEDYTYSDYFVGRNQFKNWGSQQIMTRDGGFKVRTDLLSSKVGKTDDWLIAANFSTDIPPKINPFQVLPVKIPLKVFADIGSYAEAWDQNAEAGKFLFDAGLQLSLFNEALNIYIPLIYSSVFKDYFRSTLGDRRFLKTISFSIDIQNFDWQKIDRKIPF